MTMQFLRTPDERFTNLKDYPFAPHYVELKRANADGLRMHYVDEGDKDGEVVLMLHGEPSWSYLYRYMIPVCAQAGHRVIAPDLIGFGKSDKPTRVEDYSYQAHMDWMLEFIEQLNLRNITLVCQDWGSLIGLRLAAEQPERFARIVVGNGMLPTGDQKMPAAFAVWKAFALNTPIFPVGAVLQGATKTHLDKEIIRAYKAPFPSQKHKAGVKAFPALVPVSPNDPASDANRAAWSVLEQWEKPFLTAFSDGDPITRGGDKYMQKKIPGCVGQNHITLKGGHFLQEDAGIEFAEAVNVLIKNTPV